jgi:hypothetical protein
MIPKLQQQVEETIDSEYDVDLQQVAEAPFQELINAVIKALVGSLQARCDQIYASSMLKTNWV